MHFETNLMYDKKYIYYFKFEYKYISNIVYIYPATLKLGYYAAGVKPRAADSDFRHIFRFQNFFGFYFDSDFQIFSDFKHIFRFSDFFGFYFDSDLQIFLDFKHIYFKHIWSPGVGA